MGGIGTAGDASYGNGTFTIKASGAQIYGTADAMHWAYQPLSGDGTIVARLVSVQGAAGYASAGVMIRESLDPGSRNAKTADWPGYNAIYFDLRTSPGGATSEPGSRAARSTMGSRADLITIIKLMEQGRLVPVVDAVLPMAEIRQAHALLEERKHFGKVVLTP